VGARKSQGILRAIGLMSGTSMDGIDVALLETDGEDRVTRGPGASFPYEVAFRRRLAGALQTATAIRQRTHRPGELRQIEEELTRRHAAAVAAFLNEAGLSTGETDIIGFHGQTVLHRPEKALTVQLGNGQMLADQTGIRIAFDLRANDMAHGGQGAPLVPVYHRALAANLPQKFAGREPVAFVNIGGIANVTWIGAGGEMIAFDTGPGNALIDQWMEAKAGIPFDQGGRIASEGGVVAAIAERYLTDPYLKKRAPKSLDRGDFPPLAPELASLEDGARTLAHVTAAAIWAAGEHLPARPRLWVLCGGGRRNSAIVSDLRALAEDDTERFGTQVILAEDAGFNGDTMEAEAWAYLAVRSLRGLPLTWPGTTGTREPVSGGLICLPSRQEQGKDR
jgi:anhydro-N-acetylmuramic acid kinase